MLFGESKDELIKLPQIKEVKSIWMLEHCGITDNEKSDELVKVNPSKRMS